MDWIRYDENGKEWWWLQLWNSNARRCKWYRSEAEWNEIKNSRNSRLAWFLSHTQVIGGDQENKAESTDHFLSQTNSSIDSTSQEVTIKRATPSVKRESILFSRSSVHSTTNDSLHFHNVKASDTPIPHLIRTIEMKSPLNQWNQQRYYRDAEGSKMVKHNPFQLIIEKWENPNESFQLHSLGFYKQWKSESLDELAFEWVNRKQLCFGKWNNDADWTA